jgi:hypothetical protein
MNAVGCWRGREAAPCYSAAGAALLVRADRTDKPVSHFLEMTIQEMTISMNDGDVSCWLSGVVALSVLIWLAIRRCQIRAGSSGGR